MAKLPTRKRIFDVRGEAQTNDDGVNRQDIIRELNPGDGLKLKREPNNPVDSNAIRVLTAKGEPIGYLERQGAAQIANAIDEGRSCVALLHEIRGGVKSAPNYGVKVSITWDGKDPPRPLPLDDRQIDFRDRRSGERTGCLVVALLLFSPVLLLI